MARARRLFALALSLALAAPAAAQESARDFYKGKQIQFATMGSAGGGYDAYVRAIGAHLEKRLGARVIPVNEPGAGGLIIMSRLQIAKPDGLTILLIGGEAIAAAQLFEEPGVNFDLARQVFLARVSAESKVVLLGPKSPYKSIGEMIASDRPVLWAGSGKTDGNTDFSAILAFATGMKSKMIIGYKGTGGMTLAMENGEVDGRVISDESATLFGASGGMRVMATLARARAPQFPDAPAIFESAKMSATGEKYVDWRARLAALGRIILVTPGTPPDRVELLRTTLAEVLGDPAFLVETKKLGLSVSHGDAATVGNMVRGVMTGLDAKSLAEIRDITLNRYY